MKDLLEAMSEDIMVAGTDRLQKQDLVRALSVLQSRMDSLDLSDEGEKDGADTASSNLVILIEVRLPSAKLLATGLGLSWEWAGATRPVVGKELIHGALAESLAHTLSLTTSEWESLGIPDLEVRVVRLYSCVCVSAHVCDCGSVSVSLWSSMTGERLPFCAGPLGVSQVWQKLSANVASYTQRDLPW